MKKVLGILVIASVILSGCEGDYTLTEAKLVSKTSDSNGFHITVEKDGSKYNYNITEDDYKKYEEGSLVDISDTFVDGVQVMPGRSEH